MFNYFLENKVSSKKLSVSTMWISDIFFNVETNVCEMRRFNLMVCNAGVMHIINVNCPCHAIEIVMGLVLNDVITLEHLVKDDDRI